MNRLYEEVDVKDVASTLIANGMKVFMDDSKRYNLNIVNIRSKETKAGKFDDLQVVFWFENSKIKYKKFVVTTDPGVPYLLKPLTSRGTAIVVPGQYKGVWRIGKHRGKYDALVQRGELLVFRDNDKNSIIDYRTLKQFNGTNLINNASIIREGEMFIADAHIQKGLFGINCHRASAYSITEIVGLYSAGCCVHNNPKQYDVFINLCKLSSMNWGNSFTSTWITENDLNN